MEMARRLRLVEDFPDFNPAGALSNSPVDSIPFLIAEDGRTDVGAYGVLAAAAVCIFRVNQGHFELFVVQLEQGSGVHRDDIARHLLRFDDNGPLKLMFKLNDGRAFFEDDQAFQPGLVDLGNVALRI